MSLGAGACAVRASPAELSEPDALYTVLRNGRLLHVSGGSALDLLKHPYVGRVARADGATARGESVVLLDRVQLDGVDRLADVPVPHVASISVFTSNRGQAALRAAREPRSHSGYDQTWHVAVSLG